MFILLWAILILGVATFAAGIFLPGKDSRRSKQKKGPAKELEPGAGSLSAEPAMLKSEYEKVKEDYETLKNERNEAMAEISSLQDELQKLKQRLDGRQGQKNSSNALGKELLELKTGHVKIQRDNRALTAERDKAQSQINELTAKLNKLQEELASRKSVEPKPKEEETRTSALKEELTNLKNDYAKVQLDYKALTAERDKAQSQINELTAKLNKLQEELASRKELDIKSQDEQAQTSALREELANLKNDYVKVQKELEITRENNSDLEKRLLRQKESPNIEQAKIEELNKQITEFKNNLASKEEEIESRTAHEAELEKILKQKEEEFTGLIEEKKTITSKVDSLGEQIRKLEQGSENHKKPAIKQKIDDGKTQKIPKPEKTKVESKPRQTKKKIGQILLSHNFIDHCMLDEALDYHEKSGAPITQYLLTKGYIDESQLVQCLCSQFRLPFLPLRFYEITDKIIRLIPAEIVKKYMLIPVDKTDDALTLVMADPLDEEAIREVETATNCKVQLFVGLFSDIASAIEHYYNVIVKDIKPGEKEKPPVKVETKSYQGAERRQFVRHKANFEAMFLLEGQYRKSRVINVSRGGFAIESDTPLHIGDFASLQVDLPKDYHPSPIVSVVQVVRIHPLENNKFEIGVKIIKVEKEDIDAILKFATGQQPEDKSTGSQ